jgi:Ran GTPase-activating protein (RanGAP) involved in mRNA processing and transport
MRYIARRHLLMGDKYADGEEFSFIHHALYHDLNYNFALAKKALSASLPHVPPLENLQLEGNKYTDKGAVSIIQSLANMKTNVLEHLNLANNLINVEGCRELGSFLGKEHCVLKSLNLSHNNLNDRAMQNISLGLIKNDILENVNLSYNKFGCDGARALAKAVEASKSLKTLVLRWNCLRGEGALSIAKSIADNISLTSVDLAHNSFGSAFHAEMGYLVAVQIGNIFARNRKLVSLNLDSNSFAASEIPVLQSALEQNRTLIQLFFRLFFSFLSYRSIISHVFNLSCIY